MSALLWIAHFTAEKLDRDETAFAKADIEDQEFNRRQAELALARCLYQLTENSPGQRATNVLLQKSHPHGP